MHIASQKTTLVDANNQAQADLNYLIDFLQSAAKFQGQGDDWVRTGEVWPILQAIRNDLQNTLHQISS